MRPHLWAQQRPHGKAPVPLPGLFHFWLGGIILAFGRPELLMIPEVDLSIPPTDAKAANGYAELYALWKADENAYNQGRRKSGAEFII